MADAIVVGAGICGAATAHSLAERGAEVLVLDVGEVGAGATAKGEGNVLVSDKPPGPERELARLGRERWMQLGKRFPDVAVVRKGALVLDVPAGEEPGALEPALAAGVLCQYEADELQVDAPAMARALLADLPVRTSTHVASVGAELVVLDDGARLSAAHVVVATGAWAAELSGLPVEPRRGQLAALAAPPGLIRHKLIEAAYVYTVASPSSELQIAAVIEQTLAGDEILIGSSRERVGFDPQPDPGVTSAMLARARHYVPALAHLPLRRVWCGFRAWFPDGRPAIGRSAAGVWVNVGHEGSGVGLGPICGDLLAAQINGEIPGFDLAPFAPVRFGA